MAPVFWRGTRPQRLIPEISKTKPMACKLQSTMSGFARSGINTKNSPAERPPLRFTRQFRVGRSGTIMIAGDDNAAALLSYALKGTSVKNPIRWFDDIDAVTQFLTHCEAGGINDVDDLPLLLLLDWNMPQNSAIEILKWIRQQPRYSDLLVVVVADSNDAGQKQLAYEAGANWHLVKSVNFTDLIRLVRHVRAFWSSAVEPGFSHQMAARSNCPRTRNRRRVFLDF